MPRPVTVADEQLLQALTREFRRVGYEGASVASLAAATGLKKASLYHRFPGGKAQMAQEVLAAAGEWLQAHVLEPLRSDAPPAARVDAMIRELDSFYEGGRQACLLNVLSTPICEEGPFATLVRESFSAWIDALAATLRDAGIDETTARQRARRAIALIQGHLVLARGLQTTAPFEDCLAELPRWLLEDRAGQAD